MAIHCSSVLDSKWVPSAPLVSTTPPSFWVVSFVMILSYDLGLSLTWIEPLEFCALDLLPSWSSFLSHCARTEEIWSNLIDVEPSSSSPQTNGQGRTSLITYSINPSCSNSKLSKILKQLFSFCPAFMLVISKLSNIHSFKVRLVPDLAAFLLSGVH